MLGTRQWVEPWIIHMGCVLMHSRVCARLHIYLEIYLGIIYFAKAKNFLLEVL